MQVWDEFFPLRDATGDDPLSQLAVGRERRVLPARLPAVSQRRTPRLDDASKTMLGATQQAWLVAGAARVDRDVQAGVHERAARLRRRRRSLGRVHDRARRAVRGARRRCPGIVFFSGDQHWFAAHRHAYGIREFQVGPLARGLGMPGPTGAGRAVSQRAATTSALIDIDGRPPDDLRRRCRWQRFYKETLSAADLTPM